MSLQRMSATYLYLYAREEDHGYCQASDMVST